MQISHEYLAKLINIFVIKGCEHFLETNMQQTLTDLNRKMLKKASTYLKLYALDSSGSIFITFFVQYMMDNT